MATIQVRDIPDDVHTYLTGQADKAGQSLQAYMRQQIVDLARSRARRSAALAEVEAVLQRDGGLGLSAEEIVAALHQDRR